MLALVILALAGPKAFAEVIGLPLPGASGTAKAASARVRTLAPDTPPQERTVVVEGRANLNAGIDVARRQALLDGYRRAVSAGGATEIAEFSQLRNFKDVVDIVTKRTHGWIRHHEIVSEGQARDGSETYVVTLRAVVVDRLEGQRDDVLRQMVLMAGSPRVLFLLASYDAGESRGVAMGADGRMDAAHAGTVEHMLAREFADVGYQVLTSSDVLAAGGITAAQVASARTGSGLDAAHVGRRLDADVVVVGTLRYSISAMSGGGTDVKPTLGSVSVNARAVIPSSGKVVGITSTQQRHMVVRHHDQFMVREESTARAARVVANELKWAIPEVLANEPRLIRVSVTGTTYDQADSVRRVLAQLAGIERVSMLGWSNGHARYEVSSLFTGPTETELFSVLRGRFPEARMLEMEKYSFSMTLR